jgi:hypothetical protein
MRRHIRYGSKIYVLHDGFKIFVLGIVTTQFQFCLQGNSIGKATFNALLNGISGWIYKVVQKFQNEYISGICNGEVFTENHEKSFAFAFIGGCVKLKKFLERLQLHIEEVGVFNGVFYFAKRNPIVL